MEITYLGASAFRLRGKDATVVTDPLAVKPDLKADIITVSSAAARCFPEGSIGETRVVEGPGEYEIADVLIAGVATAARPGAGAENTAYVLRFDDLAICHLGSITSRLTAQQIEEIGNIDVLLLPVGGGGTLGPTEAAEVVTQLEPALVVPMRYRLNGAEDGLEPVDHFCREMGNKEFSPEPKLTVTRNSLPSEVRVVVLQHRGS